MNEDTPAAAVNAEDTAVIQTPLVEANHVTDTPVAEPALDQVAVRDTDPPAAGMAVNSDDGLDHVQPRPATPAPLAKSKPKPKPKPKSRAKKTSNPRPVSDEEDEDCEEEDCEEEDDDGELDAVESRVTTSSAARLQQLRDAKLHTTINRLDLRRLESRMFPPHFKEMKHVLRYADPAWIKRTFGVNGGRTVTPEYVRDRLVSHYNCDNLSASSSTMTKLRDVYAYTGPTQTLTLRLDERGNDGVRDDGLNMPEMTKTYWMGCMHARAIPPDYHASPRTYAELLQKELRLNAYRARRVNWETERATTIFYDVWMPDISKEGQDSEYRMFDGNAYYVSGDQRYIITDAPREGVQKFIRHALEVYNRIPDEDTFLAVWSNRLAADTERKADTISEEVAKMRATIAKKEGLLGRLRFQGTLLRASSSKLREDLDRMKSVEGVKEVEFSRKGFLIRTGDTMALIEERGKKPYEIFLGAFEILLDFNGGIKFRNTAMVSKEVSPHPHCFYRGNACLGGYENLLGTRLRQYDFPGVVRVVMDYLGSVNMDDGPASLRVPKHHPERKPKYSYVVGDWTNLLMESAATHMRDVLRDTEEPDEEDEEE